MKEGLGIVVRRIGCTAAFVLKQFKSHTRLAVHYAVREFSAFGPVKFFLFLSQGRKQGRGLLCLTPRLAGLAQEYRIVWESP